MRKTILWFPILLVFLSIGAISEVKHIPLNKARNSIWVSDSLFLGGSMKVIDSTKNLIVVHKKSNPFALGKLSFLVPGKNSEKFVFHNMISKFPQESDSVDLGKYPKDTPIIFCYILTDTSKMFANVSKKKLYTGQNRPGKDCYVSENEGPFKRKWAIVGEIDSVTCEVGFAAAMPAVYSDIRFLVYNVKVVK